MNYRINELNWELPLQYFFKILVISLTLYSGWAVEPKMVNAEAMIVGPDSACHGANCSTTKHGIASDVTTPRESVLTPGSFFLLGIGLIALRVVGKRVGRAK